MIATIITLVVAFVISGWAMENPRARAWWGAWQAHMSPGRVVVGAGGIYLVALGGMATLRHLSFNSNALDMALMDQLVWNSAQGRWFEESLLAGFPTSFLGHHFSPTLAVLVPLYWLVPRPETLIVVQTLCIVGSALLLYRTATKLTGLVWVAAALALMVLLHPLVQDAALFDFHQDVLGMFFLALGLFGLTYQRWGVAAVGWLLSILAKEEVAIYWMAIGIFLFVVEGRQRGWKALFVLINALWLYAVMRWLIPAFQEEGVPGFFFGERYSFWGDSIGDAFGTIASNPISVMQNLLLPDRIGGLGMMLLPGLLFLLRSHWSILLLFIPLGINTLADYVGQHNYRFHYSLLPIVIIVYACMWAVVWMQRKGNPKLPRRVAHGAVFMVIASAMLFVGVSQMGLRFPGLLQDYLPTAHEQVGRRVVQMIPAEASVIAQNKLVAHLSQRRWVTLFSRQLAAPAEYYLLDLQSPTPPQTIDEYVAEVTALVNNAEYGIVHLEDSYILLARGATYDASAAATALQLVEQFFPAVVAP